MNQPPVQTACCQLQQEKNMFDLVQYSKQIKSPAAPHPSKTCADTWYGMGWVRCCTTAWLPAQVYFLSALAR